MLSSVELCVKIFDIHWGGEDSFLKTQFLYKIQETYNSGEITSPAKVFDVDAECHRLELESGV